MKHLNMVYDMSEMKSRRAREGQALGLIAKGILLVVILCAVAAGAFAADQNYFPPAKDLSRELNAHPQRLKLVMVTQSDCRYCQTLHEKVLSPIDKSSVYAEKVDFWEINIDESEQLVDFSGAQVKSKDFVRQYTQPYSPILLFLDYQGAELHPAMVGLGNLDFYSFYVEKAINDSLKKIQK